MRVPFLRDVVQVTAVTFHSYSTVICKIDLFKRLKSTRTRVKEEETIAILFAKPESSGLSRSK